VLASWALTAKIGIASMTPHIDPRPDEVTSMRFFEHSVACERSFELAAEIGAA
jgi:hypothetical protein